MIKTQGRQTQNLGSISRNHPPGGFHLSPNLVFFEEYTFLSDIYLSREEILKKGKKYQMSRGERVFSYKNLENQEEKENCLKNLINREEKENFFLNILKIETRKRTENSIFSSEREIIESFLLEIFRDRDSCQ